MRSKTPLALMEQVIMVLVFALAAALCLRAFYLSDRISRSCEERDRAVQAVQTVAETLKSCHGDFSETERLVQTALDNVDVVFYHNDHWEDPEDRLRVIILPAASGSELLGCAEVSALSADGDTIVRLTVAWQEVGANE